jgi:hypothetical protein
MLRSFVAQHIAFVVCSTLIVIPSGGIEFFNQTPLYSHSLRQLEFTLDQ